MSFVVKYGGSIKLSVILIAVLATISVGFYVFETEKQFNAVSEILSDRVAKSSQSVKLLSQLSAEIGYGGFIHNFKNYVLRRDDKYKVAAQENYERIHTLSSRIEVMMNDRRVAPALESMKLTLQEYYNHFSDLPEYLEDNKIAFYDMKVKVDDTNAINSIKKLYTIIDELNDKAISDAKNKQDTAHKFVQYGYFLVLMIFLITALLLILIRNLEIKSIQEENANKAKSKFLSTMSHEIRTPLNGLLGLIQLLNLKKFSKEEKYHLDLIRSSGELLLGILNDVLDISKIEAEELHLESVPLDINDLLKTTTDFYKNIASGRGLLLNFHGSAKDVEYVNGDPTKLRQILSNILSNSIKFTEAGGVDVFVKSTLETHNGKKMCDLELKIVDTGIGMNEEAIKKLFQKFTQADDSISRRYGGTGLGMSIAKELTKLMGGTIDVSSQIGIGTTFIVQISLEVSSAHEVKYKTVGEADYRRALTGLKVLIAEDNMVNAVVAKGFLLNLGVTVKIAYDGMEAVQIFEKEKPDLILMDVNMPHKDGIQAAKDIRAKEGGRNVPILALTADAFAETRNRCLHAGMNGVITKPFSFEQLRNRLYDTVQ